MIQSFSQAAEIVRNAISSKYPQVKKAYIFGSYATGKQSPQSDLDVIVEIDSSFGLGFISMIQEIEKQAETPVDVLTANQAKNLEQKFGYDIFKDAKVIYERAKS